MSHISKDTLWKGIIEDLFEEFCYYFFPIWTEQVADFAKKPEFLDKELDEIYPEKDIQKRYADKLVKVFTKEGTEQWILIHIEVQGYKDENFAQRMFQYFHRILDKYKQKLMALAIFTDADNDFEPKNYFYQYQNTKLKYEFETFKILHKSEEELNISNNPFSIVMLTAKKALEQKNLKDSEQLIWKKELVLALKNANYSLEKIRKILQFIRFYVRFKAEENLLELNKNIQSTFKERKNMGIEEAILHEVRENGIKEGLKQGLEKLRLEKIKGIKKALQKGKLSLEDIADLFEVSLEFVLKVQRGEIA